MSGLMLASSARRALMQNLPRRGAVKTGPQPPNGFLFGEKPVAAGEVRERAPWERIYVWGMGAGFVFATVGLIFKPDTSPNTLARKEAKTRV